MIRRTLMIASCVVALSSFGDRAQAAFSITTTSTTSAASLATASSLGLTFTTNNIVNGPVPTPGGGVSFNFLNMNFSGASTFTGSGSFTLTGTFATLNDTTVGASTYSQVITFNFVNGSGNLTAGAASIVPTTTGGITFGPITFTAPTAVAGNVSMGNLSTVVTAAAVPEPSSLALCGIAGLAGLALRARRNRVAIA